MQCVAATATAGHQGAACKHAVPCTQASRQQACTTAAAPCATVCTPAAASIKPTTCVPITPRTAASSCAHSAAAHAEHTRRSRLLTGALQPQGPRSNLTLRCQKTHSTAPPRPAAAALHICACAHTARRAQHKRKCCRDKSSLRSTPIGSAIAPWLHIARPVVWLCVPPHPPLPAPAPAHCNCCISHASTRPTVRHVRP
jgi:hypothetical protein